MKVMLCHNFYQQSGGEDQVFADEKRMLSSNGHEVATFTRHNDNVSDVSRIRLAAGTIWNKKACVELERDIRRFDADVVHFHNTMPLLSPAAFRAAWKAGVAVVLTLHNYRLMCPKGTFHRNGKVCQDCLGRTPWPAIKHACYRDSVAASSVLATMMATHRTMGTYHNYIDAFISLCNFARQKHVDAGFPGEKIFLKPNFFQGDPAVGEGDGKYFMFLGRLSSEKGLNVLLDSWVHQELKIPLKIVGRGPMEDDVRAAMKRNRHISLVGNAERDDVVSYLSNAMALILPSTNFEGFPKTIVESFAVGTPVIASKLGAMEELVSAGRTGFHFTAGDSLDLSKVVSELAAHPDKLQEMRPNARDEFVQHYTEEVNHRRLMEIYGAAIEGRKQAGGADVQ